MHDFDYFYSRFPLEHNSMRLIVLIRSFNPRRTQFILQDIETRGKSFNPRAHTGRDELPMMRCSRSFGFNPRAHTGRDLLGLQRRGFPRGFNPRAHTGRDGKDSQVLLALIVSIHAPTRGATLEAIATLSQNDVSIHAPTRGATRQCRCAYPR